MGLMDSMNGRGKYLREEKLLYSDKLARKDIFGGDSSFRGKGKKTWKKFFKNQPNLLLASNTAASFFKKRGWPRNTTEKKGKKRRRKKMYPERENFFSYIFPSRLSSLLKKGRLRKRSISSHCYTPSDRILKQTYPIVYSLLSRGINVGEKR